jgi:tetratricopeptide (TPR) repeat protein
MPHLTLLGDNHMRRLIPIGATLALVLLLATIVAAQGSTRLNGQIIDGQGKPWPGVTVQLKNPDTGQTFTLKTDKDGKYAQVLPRGGVYAITVEPEKLNYSEKHAITDGQENTIVINFKEIIAQQAASPEEAKKAEEAANNFKNMKGHFDAGVAAMTDSSQVRQQLATAPADQKSALQDKIKADSATAVTEFQGAEQAAGTKDVKNHALIWANLGQAYDLGGRYDDAAGAYQKAIELQPAAPYYTHLSTSLANAAVSQTDPKVTQQKVSDAEANCDKASTLEGAPPGSAAVCWKNLGIILNNKGDLKDAIVPFQKATQADPKDAQSWFLLGGALTGSIDTKQEGDKVIYIVPPGTTDAYQKCIEADPNGPYAPQAKAALDSLAQLSGGAQTTVSERKKKK